MPTPSFPEPGRRRNRPRLPLVVIVCMIWIAWLFLSSATSYDSYYTFDSHLLDSFIPDPNCIFRNSPIRRKVFVYPSPGDPEWQGDILSERARRQLEGKDDSDKIEHPWVAIDKRSKKRVEGPYDTKSQLTQYNTELLVRDVILHPDSCLRTYDPEEASLFYVPYWPATEFHNGTRGLGDYATTKYGRALMEATEQSYGLWEETFGLTSKYWQRRNGSDHILVYSEPMHGLWHPKSKRGNFHFINSQMQLTPPIAISVELSTTFVQMYPKCTRKNILMPYPNTDGRFFNGGYDDEARRQLKELSLEDVTSSPAALQTEKELYKEGTNSIRQYSRPLAQYYGAGMHGTCTNLRRTLKANYLCTESGKLMKNKRVQNFGLGYRQATFCPCPGGDSPSAKRMFDVLHSGCIPVVLSYDFVWPFSTEFDPQLQMLHPKSFSVRLDVPDYNTPAYDNDQSCARLPSNHGTTIPTLQDVFENVTKKELEFFRMGVEKAGDRYAWYRRRPDLPDNPLWAGVLPDGGAAHSLVQLLAERANGQFWPACQEEVKKTSPSEGAKVAKFKC